jgi:D-inositol-3-phosphate glycosyltransferase
MDRAVREDMSRAAVNHARGFGWELTAQKTLAAYQRAHETLAIERANERAAELAGEVSE